jgi:hypothetical protein
LKVISLIIRFPERINQVAEQDNLANYSKIYYNKYNGREAEQDNLRNQLQKHLLSKE